MQLFSIHKNLLRYFISSMKLNTVVELMIARIDSMRAADQLVVKFASALGPTIKIDILEMLLPKAHRPKLLIVLRRLMETGIFECSNKAETTNTVSIKNLNHSLKYECYCNLDNTPSYSIEVCPNLRFANNLLQDTAYEMMIENQRGELHTRAANFLEFTADTFRKELPFQWLCRPPPGCDLENQLKHIDFKLQGTTVCYLKCRYSEI